MKILSLLSLISSMVAIPMIIYKNDCFLFLFLIVMIEILSISFYYLYTNSYRFNYFINGIITMFAIIWLMISSMFRNYK